MRSRKPTAPSSLPISTSPCFGQITSASMAMMASPSGSARSLQPRGALLEEGAQALFGFRARGR
ncbi:MAG: hypothetical protein ACK40A_06310, partial [Pannonibacter indicus]